MDEWLDLKAAADFMGLSVNYFRQIYCSPGAPLVMISERIGPKGGRRIRVNAADLERISEAMIHRPAGYRVEA